MNRLEQLPHRVPRPAKGLDFVANGFQIVADAPHLAADRFQLRGEMLAVDTVRAFAAELVEFPGELVEGRCGVVAVGDGLEPLADLRKLGFVGLRDNG